MKDPERFELDRILADEEELQPMTGFSTRVMRAVRDEATESPPLPFPWRRFALGLLLNLGLLLGAAVWLFLGADSPSLAPSIPTQWLSPQAPGLIWATATLIGSGALAWTISKWVTPRRASF